MTKKEYVRYFNLEIKFNNLLKKYLKNYVLLEDEILDDRAISHSFLKGDIIQINYYITDLTDDFGKRVHKVSFMDFENFMGIT